MQPGTLIAGKYRVERMIGRGGMGVVVEATHLQLEARVALKFLDEVMASDATAVARFTREARACAQLKSEHVCRVTDFGVEGKAPYIVMELLTGTDLARLCKLRTLDVPTAALYIKQACAGVAEAHAAQIIHRDLKPGNLFVTRRSDGSPLIKVLDFGVAKVKLGEHEVGLTAPTSVVGSPGYLSPEQFRSSKTVDGRTDVWSLGVILYKLVSGRLPFQADNFAEFALAISSQPTPPLPEAPPEFESIVARCLDKDPARRFASANALADALSAFAAHASAVAPDPAPTKPVAPAKSPAVKATLLGTPSAQPESRGVAPPDPRDLRSQPTMAGTAVGVAKAPSPRLRDLAERTIVGEYRIETKIGEGGMGAVYAAIHPLIGKKAAIKVISAELGADPVVVQRFVQEARSVNQIGHPNIVDVFAFGKLEDGRNYFVMELLEGESLRERTSRMFIPLAEAIQIFDEIAGALEAAHEQRIVHRDLKPDNVFLAKTRRHIIVKLLDFGIAKLAAADGIGISKTNTGELIGTPAYLSPEQARGKNVDHRTDIYALGCMMFEIVTGRMPFMADSAMDIVMMHITRQPDRPSTHKPDIPPSLDQLIVQMMDKDPDRRPSLVAVRHVFAELVASGAVPIEVGSGATLRSELARSARDLEAGGRTPRPGTRHRKDPPTPAEQDSAVATTSRRREPPRSEAPTNIVFTPGPDTISPAATMVRAPARSRRGLAIAAVGAAMMVPAVSIAVAVLRGGLHGRAPGSDGAQAVIAGDAGLSAGPAAIASQPAADAAPAAIDASAEPVLRDVEILVNVANARIEIDGTAAAQPLKLPDGRHQLVVTAAGRVPVETTLEVSATMQPIEVKLARTKPRPPVEAGAQASPPAHAPPPPPPVVRPKGDETIDPFK